MKYQIDLRERFSAAFGFVASNALPRVANVGLAGKLFYANLDTFEPQEAVYKSQMGTPVYDQFTFNFEGDTGPESYTFELPPMVDLHRRKNINITPVNDGDGLGEVVESFGNMSWDIRFRGLLVDMEEHKRPTEQIRGLLDFFEENRVLHALSDLFDLYHIYNIYLMEIDLPALEGFTDTQPYEIIARSYVPANLFID